MTSLKRTYRKNGMFKLATKVCLVELFSKHLGKGEETPSGMQR